MAPSRVQWLSGALCRQLFGLVASMMLFCTLGYQRRRMHTYRSYDCTAALLVEQAGSEGTRRSLRSL